MSEEAKIEEVKDVHVEQSASTEDVSVDTNAETLTELEKILGVEESGNSESDESSDESESDNIADKKEEENSSDEKKSDPVIDDYLLSKAEEFGFTDAEIRQFKSSVELSRALSVIERKVKSLSLVPEKVEEEKKEEVKDELSELLEGLCPADFTEEKMIQVVKALKSDKDSLGKRLEKLEEENNKLKSETAKNYQDQIISEFDELASGQTGKLSELFGKGTISKGLSVSEAENRKKLFKTFTAIGNTLGENEDVPVKEVFRRALAATFPDEYLLGKEEEIKSNINKRKGLALMPPGGVKRTTQQIALEEIASILKNKKE